MPTTPQITCCFHNIGSDLLLGILSSARFAGHIQALSAGLVWVLLCQRRELRLQKAVVAAHEGPFLEMPHASKKHAFSDFEQEIMEGDLCWLQIIAVRLSKLI